MMTHEERCAALEQRCAALELQVTQLREHLEVVLVRASGFRSIRDSRTCPACGCRTFVHIRQATQATHASVMPLGIAHDWKWTGPVARGVMESLTCRGCGLVELHVVDFSDLAIDGTKIVAVEPEPEPPHAGPFR